ncbi:MAG: hypothetical protein H6508_00920 [Calditrichaeota bacterium]|nr:hypothetical protein [Calditrichota bacterium]MCB9365737.1 hypothetical protein [Calditrichota bacterium]
MSRKLVPKIILEGTRLTHKTDLAFALNEHPRVVGPRKYRYPSPLISGEWCAFSNFPWGRGLVNFAPEEEAQALETYATWARLFELERYYSWIVDRFHFSTIMHQHLYGQRTYDFRWLEERLLPLGFRVVLCTRARDTFEAARAERLKVSGNPSQYDDLSLFLREQDCLHHIAERSALPVLKLDVTSDDIPELANQIADWLEQTGGLYYPES